MFPLNAYLGHRQATAIQMPQMTTAACCAHVCVWKACDLAADGVMTLASCEWTNRQRGRTLDDAAHSIGPPKLVCELKKQWLEEWR